MKLKREHKVIENNAALVAKLKDYNLPDKEFCSKTEKGNELNAWIMKPKDFDASKISIYVSILRTRFSKYQWNSANDYWFMMLTNKDIS
jgi:dipeptidyl-peptidase-4